MSVLATIGAAGLSGGLDFLSGERAMDHSAQMAQEQMYFQKKMSDTAIRRAAADMRAAGFNPVMAVPGAASSPGGAMGQAIATKPGTAAVQAATAVQSIKQMEQQTKQMEQQTRLLDQQGDRGEALNKIINAALPALEKILPMIGTTAKDPVGTAEKLAKQGSETLYEGTGIGDAWRKLMDALDIGGGSAAAKATTPAPVIEVKPERKRTGGQMNRNR